MISRFSARRTMSEASLPDDLSSPLDDVSWTVFPNASPEPATAPALPPVPPTAPANVAPPPAPSVAAPAPTAAPPNPLLRDKMLDAKVRLHRRLIEEINLSALEKLPEDDIRRHIQQLVSQYILVERLALNTQELADFVAEILDEMTGLGPIEPLLKDQSINDILINGPRRVHRARRHPGADRVLRDEGARIVKIFAAVVAALTIHPFAMRASRWFSANALSAWSQSTVRRCRSANSRSHISTSSSIGRRGRNKERWRRPSRRASPRLFRAVPVRKNHDECAAAFISDKERWSRSKTRPPQPQQPHVGCMRRDSGHRRQGRIIAGSRQERGACVRTAHSGKCHMKKRSICCRRWTPVTRII